MGRWLAKVEKSLDMKLTKPTKPSSVGFVSAHSANIHFSSHIGKDKKYTSDNYKENSSVSFVGTYISAFSLLKDFISKASSFGIDLLPDDERWLKSICYAVPLLKLKSLLEQYITRWLSAIKSEPLPHRQQNTGRFAANTFIRESLAAK